MSIKLNAKNREVFAKKLKGVREDGWLPVVVYGAKTENNSFIVDVVEFGRVFKEAGESSMVSLVTEDGEKDILIHDVQFHPTSGKPIHADLLVIDRNKKVEVPVPLVFEGVAPAIKELGGNLVKVLHEIQVEALPKDLPHDIMVDISSLVDLDSQILAKDLKLPNGVSLMIDPDDVVASISQAGEEVVEETEPTDLSAIEVEKKGKEETEEESA